MIVLSPDERLNDDGSVIIPPFQAGHLGFIPDRHVQVYLLAPRFASRHCEVVVSPYMQDRRNGELLRLVCVMKERPGVVRRLLRSLAILGINVIAQESCVIRSQQQHYVSLIIDFTESHLVNVSPSNKNTIGYYRHEAAVVPIYQNRYVTMFESIIAHCGDVLEWGSGEPRLPRLNIQPLEPDTANLTSGPLQIGRRGASYKDKEGVLLPLDQITLNHIRRELNTTTVNLPYLLVSETEYRRLRIIFPHPDQFDKIIHVGFYHWNLYGALDAIVTVLAENGFNILSSLHRSIDLNEGVWEAMLEYRGTTFPAAGSSFKDKCEWLAGLMSAKSDASDELATKGVRIGFPLYPKPLANLVFEPIPLAITSTPVVASNNPIKSYKAQIDETLKDQIDLFKAANVLTDENTLALNLMERIQKRRKPGIRLFLSYPNGAGFLAELVKDAIQTAHKDKFLFDEYQKPDGREILRQVTTKIEDCVGFIGIWHPGLALSLPDMKEKKRKSKKTIMHSVSPWMPCELGMALIRSKDCFVVASELVDPSFCTRITPHVAIVKYNDNTFSNDVSNNVVEWCYEKFILGNAEGTI